MNNFEQLKKLREKTIEKWSKLGYLDHFYETIDIKDIRKKKLNQINNFSGPVDNTKVSTNNDFSSITFPIVKRVLATTLGGGGWIKSTKQQLKENRLNKLRQLQGEKPNVVLPNDEYVNGLVSVQPLSAPIGKLFYMDYKYGPTIKQTRKSKLNKINNTIRLDKLKYIDSFLKL